MSNRNSFLFLIGLSLLLTYSTNAFIITDDVYQVYFMNQLSITRIETFLELKNKWQWFSYLLLPIIIFFKIAGIAACLFLATYITNLKAPYSILFSAALKAEYIHLLPALTGLFWFSFIQTTYSLEDTQNFAPLSLLNLFDSHRLEQWEKYPLSFANIFQVLYIGILSYEIYQKMDISFTDSLRFVLYSIMPVFIVWITWITFLTVSFT